MVLGWCWDTRQQAVLCCTRCAAPQLFDHRKRPVEMIGPADALLSFRLERLRAPHNGRGVAEPVEENHVALAEENHVALGGLGVGSAAGAAGVGSVAGGGGAEKGQY